MLQRKLLKLILALTVISHHIIIMRWLILEGGILAIILIIGHKVLKALMMLMVLTQCVELVLILVV